MDFEAPAEPLNVTVQLDEAATASSTITPSGGSLSLTAADGTVFTLDVPAEALAADTLITMTAVKSIEGAPLSSGMVAAVQLEPSGLFFSEAVTLTIVPAQEIPIENQIIFGYEGDGQDYHLAVVDPKSKEIKIKLMEFSGAGVGSGGDAQWAANLQIQANATGTRLDQKLGEATQVDRRANVLVEGDETSNELEAITESILDQYYDQVALKEMAAAELDCQYAQKAIDELLKVESLRQHLLYTDGKVTIPDLAGKLEKLIKIREECKKAYRVSGESNEVSFSGEICGLDKPFVIDATFPGGGSASTTFTPGDVTGGVTTVSGGGGDCVQTGGGKYTVTINEDGNGSIQWTTTDTLTCPLISQTKTGSFTFPLQLAPDITCP